MQLTLQQLDRISELLRENEAPLPRVEVHTVEFPGPGQPPTGCQGAVTVELKRGVLLIAVDGRVLNAGAIIEQGR